MILKDLIDSCNSDEIINRIISTYPREERNRKKYEKLIESLRKMTPDTKEFEEDPWILYVKQVRDIIEPKEIYHETNAYSIKTKTSYACDYMPFSQWLAMEISEPSLKHYGINDFLAHVLWDMTIVSFDEKVIQNEADYLLELSKSFHSDIVNQQNTIDKNTECLCFPIPEINDIEEDNISQTEIDLIIKENSRIEREMLGLN